MQSVKYCHKVMFSFLPGPKHTSICAYHLPVFLLQRNGYKLCEYWDTAARSDISGQDDTYHLFLHLSILAELNPRCLATTRKHGLLRTLSMTH